MNTKEEDRKFPVTEERERELLSEGVNPEALSETAKSFKKKLQEKSLEGVDDYTRILYMITDYLGITSPDKRLALKLKKSEESCMKQRVLISRYERKIMNQEQLIAEKEKELNDCIVCFEKRKAQIEETTLRAERLEEERQELEQRIQKNPGDKASEEAIGRINNALMEAEQELRKYEREKNEFISKIVENEHFIKEAKNTLVSNQKYIHALRGNYLRSRIERMRLSPFIEMGMAPVETIESIVQDYKIADDVGNLADEMSSWVCELTDIVADINITPRKRNGIYEDMSKKYKSSSKSMESVVEKIIEERRKSKYT